ncbi:MAG: MBL fold metallo-hydrolase [Lachnospiraceae bacterium]|nr:MBL fold metallo-hydrolase [Lachnospiraceae bacterium]
MRIVNLIENTAGESGCAFEHGLSFYVETDKHKLLVDTGATDAFLMNAEALGIDLREVDSVILSHGHYDHGGGILAFAKQNPHAGIYIRDCAFEPLYHKNEQMEKYIGLNPEIRNLPQVIMVRDNLRIDEELFLFTNVTGRRLWPAGNLELKRKTDDGFIVDQMEHEQYLLISFKDRLLLFSGCAHNGVLNILDACKKLTGRVPDAVISGFHMRKKNGYTEEDFELIRQTARELKQYPTHFYTGHCTGLIPYDIMKEIMGDQLSYVHSGDRI